MTLLPRDGNSTSLLYRRHGRFDILLIWAVIPGYRAGGETN